MCYIEDFSVFFSVVIAYFLQRSRNNSTRSAHYDAETDCGKVCSLTVLNMLLISVAFLRCYRIPFTALQNYSVDEHYIVSWHIMLKFYVGVFCYNIMLEYNVGVLC